MVLQFEAMAFGDFPLKGFDLGTDEFDDPAGLDADHVVVVLAAIELIDRMSAFEMMLGHEPRRFELGQHAIDGRDTDVGTDREQFPVDVFRGEVPAFLLRPGSESRGSSSSER